MIIVFYLIYCTFVCLTPIDNHHYHHHRHQAYSLPYEIIDEITKIYFIDSLYQPTASIVSDYVSYSEVCNTFKGSADGYFSRLDKVTAQTYFKKLDLENDNHPIREHILSLIFPRLSIRNQVDVTISWSLRKHPWLQRISKWTNNQITIFLESSVFAGLLVTPDIILGYEKDIMEAKGSTPNPDSEETDFDQDDQDLDFGNVQVSFINLFLPFSVDARNLLGGDEDSLGEDWGSEWDISTGFYCVLTGHGAGILLTQSRFDQSKNEIGRLFDVLIGHWMFQMANGGTLHPADAASLQQFLRDEIPFLSRQNWRIRAGNLTHLSRFVVELMDNIAEGLEEPGALDLTESPGTVLFVILIAGSEMEFQAILDFIYENCPKTASDMDFFIIRQPWKLILRDTFGLLETLNLECRFFKSQRPFSLASGSTSINLVDNWLERQEAWFFSNPKVCEINETTLPFPFLDNPFSFPQ